MAYKNPSNNARRKWSLSVKTAACNKCAFCGSSERLESHHIFQLADYPDLELSLDNGVCLCHRCHVLAHGGTFYRNSKGMPGGYRSKEERETIKVVQSFVLELSVKRKLQNRSTITETMERDNSPTADENG